MSSKIFECVQRILRMTISWAWKSSPQSEPILPISRIRKLRRTPETPGGLLAIKDVLILVSFLNLASGYENMNDHLF